MAQRQGLTTYRMITIALFLVSTAPFAAAVLRGIVKTINYTSPVYTVAIDSVGGLDADLGAPVSPVFNLTLRIDERTGRRDACIGHRAAAAVDYRGLVLGRGPAPEFCVDEATGAAEAPAVAWGTNIKIPEFLRGQLREELSRGEAAFSVSVRVPNDRTAGNGPDVVFECRAKVGEESAPCAETYISARDRDDTFHYRFPIRSW
jgi:hypothetical protein